jgi:hypothetical protein
MEMIRRPVLLIRPDVKVTQPVLAPRVGTGNYASCLAGVTTAVFCSRGHLAERPEEKNEGSGSEVY